MRWAEPAADATNLKKEHLVALQLGFFRCAPIARWRGCWLPLCAAALLTHGTLVFAAGAAGAGGAPLAATPSAARPSGAEPAAGAPAQAPLHPCTAPESAQPPLAPLPQALAQAIRERVHNLVGGEIYSVCPTPFGLYEVVVDAEVIYVDERVHYLLAGNAFDLRTQQNLTAHRKEEAFRVDFKTLPLQMAVKTVRGSGAHVLAVFEDPNCPYCKRFEKDIATLSDTTIYTFLYPILSRDINAADDSYPKARAIWCAPDRTLAWAQVMLEGKRLAPPPAECKPPLDDILALGQKLHVTGTPTLLFADGRRAPGAIPLEQVQEMIDAAEKAQAPAASVAPAGAPGAH